MTHTSPPSWRAVLVRQYEEPASTPGFTTAPTRDLLLVVQRAGCYRLESRAGSRWVAADYRPGSMGLTAPGATSVLRWQPARGDAHDPAHEHERPSSSRRSPSEPLMAGEAGGRAAAGAAAPAGSTLQVHIAAAVVQAAATALGRPRLVHDAFDVLDLHDPGVLACALALSAASQAGAPRLAGEALAEALAAQLVEAVARRRRQSARGHAAGTSRPAPAGASRATTPLSAAQVRRVVDHLHAHLHRDLGLAECAAVVGLSRAHFLRAFAAATGTTPHRYLVRLRLDRAARLLRTSELTVLDVAVRCGYAGTSHFAEAFARAHGDTPTSYRRAHRAGTPHLTDLTDLADCR